MSEFRKAKCIELHDSNLCFTVAGEGYDETAPLGRTEDPYKPAFKINLADLRMLGEMFGLHGNGTVQVPIDSTQNTAMPGEPQQMTEIDLPVYKVHNDEERETRESRITALECEIVSAYLLNIRVTRTFNKPDDTVAGMITYSGAFTVWWQD